jgi:hypothetical protein
MTTSGALPSFQTRKFSRGGFLGTPKTTKTSGAQCFRGFPSSYVEQEVTPDIDIRLTGIMILEHLDSGVEG